MKVKEIMDRKYPAIHHCELVTKARAVFRELSLRMMPVVNEDHKLVGILLRRDIMAVSSNVSPIQVTGIMRDAPYSTTPDGDAFEAMKAMLGQNEWYAPVTASEQDKSYVGVLGLENFIDAVIKNSPEKFSKSVSDIMSTGVICASPDDEVDDVWRLMQDKSFSGLPVVRNGKLIGMVTQEDLLKSGKVFPTFESKKGRFRESPKISSVMTTGVVTVNPSVKAIRIGRVMLSSNIGTVPVVDEKGQLIGIVDREDVAKLAVK